MIFPKLTEVQVRSLFTTDKGLPLCKVGEHAVFAFARHLEKDEDISILDWKFRLHTARRATAQHGADTALSAQPDAHATHPGGVGTLAARAAEAPMERAAAEGRP